jgi:hypothetical protein
MRLSNARDPSEGFLSAWQSQPLPADPKGDAPTDDAIAMLLHEALWSGRSGHPAISPDSSPLSGFGLDIVLPVQPHPPSSGFALHIVLPAQLDPASDLDLMPVEELPLTNRLWWRQAAQEAGQALDFSSEADVWTPAMPGPNTRAQASGNPSDPVVPGAAKARAKIEFSSAECSDERQSQSADPGAALLSDNNEIVLLPPRRPNPQIASPEPGVTALWAISAVVLACRRWPGRKTPALPRPSERV